MQALRPDETVRLLLEARSAGDLVRIIILLDPAVSLQPMPGERALEGADAVQRHIQHQLAEGVRVEAEAHRITVEGDRVHVVGRRRVFEQGSLSDSPAQWTFTVRDGRVTHMRPMVVVEPLERVA